MATTRAGKVYDFQNTTYADAVVVVDAAGTAITSTVTVTMTHTVGTATSTTSAMLAANTSRRYALLVNDGGVDVYLKIGVAAAANQGIRLTPNGGSYEMSPAFGNLATGAINGITVSGTASVLVTEGS